MTATGRPRGRKPLLDEPRVIQAALSVLDTEGLSALSMRRIGSDLGVSHMTLYSTFDSKDALLEAVATATIDVPTAHHRTGEAWDHALFAAICDIHEALTRRPAIAELLVSQSFDGTRIASVRESLLDLLRGAGFIEEQARDGISMLFNFMLGAVLIDAQRARGGSPRAFRQGLRYLITGLSAELD